MKVYVVIGHPHESMLMNDIVVGVFQNIEDAEGTADESSSNPMFRHVSVSCHDVQ